MKILQVALLVFELVVFQHFALAANVPINLNGFGADPSVTVAPDGASAVMAEDQNLGSVLLSNSPLFGGSGLPVTGNLTGLSFEYSFSRPQGNQDQFYAVLFDVDTFDIIHELLIEASGNGLVTWDLSAVGSGVKTLGLEFQLNALSNDSLLTSTVSINNPQLITDGLAPVPLPAGLWLFLSGIFGISLCGKKPYSGRKWFQRIKEI